MKYEKPNLEVIKFEETDVIRTSLTGEGAGGGTDVGGDGNQPWN